MWPGTKTIPAEIYVLNQGDVWNSDYGVVSVDPGNVPTLVNRWGVTSAPLVGDGGTSLRQDFTMTLTGPPISPLSYPTPVGAATAAVPGKLNCDWILAYKGTPCAVAPVGAPVAVGRFSDVLGSGYDFCRAQIDQLAGLFPTVIVKGNNDGTYTPDTVVTRETVAVYLQRALGLIPPAYQGYFTEHPGD